MPAVISYTWGSAVQCGPGSEPQLPPQTAAQEKEQPLHDVTLTRSPADPGISSPVPLS